MKVSKRRERWTSKIRSVVRTWDALSRAALREDEDSCFAGAAVAEERVLEKKTRDVSSIG